MAAPAASSAGKGLLQGFAWGAVPPEYVPEAVRLHGPTTAAFIAIEALATTMHGFANTKKPAAAPYRVTPEQIAERYNCSVPGAKKALAQFAGKIGHDGAVAGLFSCEPSEKDGAYTFKLLDLERVKRFHDWTGKIEGRAQRHIEIGTKAEREERKKQRVQALLAEMVCPSCGSHTMDLRCRACGHETELTEVYVTEEMTVTNAPPEGAEVIPPPDTSDIEVPVHPAPPEPRIPQKTPVSTQDHAVAAKSNQDTGRVTSEITCQKAPAGNGNPETPVFATLFRAAFALHFFARLGKALDANLAARIAAALGSRDQLIEPFVERFLSVDPKAWKAPREEGGHSSGYCVVLAESVRLTAELAGDLPRPLERPKWTITEAERRAAAAEEIRRARLLLSYPDEQEVVRHAAREEIARLLAEFPDLEAPDADKV